MKGESRKGNLWLSLVFIEVVLLKSGYIWRRLLRSLISIFIIMLIVFTMVYTLVPRENIFFEDSTYRKLSSKSDDKTEYVYSTWEKLGYLDYVRINDYCLEKYEAGSEQMTEAVKPDSQESRDFVAEYTAKGYTVEQYLQSGRYFAYKDVPVINRMLSWLGNLISIDTPWAVKDPGNLGTLLRTADAVGIKAAVMTGESAEVYNPKVVRSTMGSLPRLELYIENDFGRVVQTLSSQGVTVCAAVVRNGEAIPGFEFPERCAAVIGNEARGLSEEDAELCHRRVTITMKGSAESLNAASAGSIIMWEMLRG